MSTDNILEWNESEIKEFMASVWMICTLGFKYHVNPLPELRKQFPQFKWEYFSYENVSNEDRWEDKFASEFVWDLGIYGHLFVHFAKPQKLTSAPNVTYVCNFSRAQAERYWKENNFFPKEENQLLKSVTDLGISF